MDKEHVKGAADKVKGAIKDTAGKVTDRPPEGEDVDSSSEEGGTTRHGSQPILLMRVLSVSTSRHSTLDLGRSS
jgi:hypothetical protein